MEKVLIVSTGKYPNGNAGAVRQHAFAKLFEMCGYSVTVIGLGESTDFECKVYDGINHISFRAKKNNLMNRIFNLIFFKSRLRRFLKNNQRFIKIVIVSIPTNALFYLKKYARKNGVELIHDSVEWYSPEHFFLGTFSLPYRINNAYNTKWIDKNFKVIAISKYLERHYLSRQIKCTNIPVIMDISHMDYKKRPYLDKLTLVYAGGAKRKDYIKEIIEGLSLLEDEELLRVELRLLGINHTELTEYFNISTDCINKAAESIKCFGRVTRQQVFKHLEEADFTILLRSPIQRYAKAGFPTKVVESLATGTPVIGNITSDLGEYLEDGYNALICSDIKPETISKVLKRALMLTPAEKAEMSTAARACAESSFDYRLFGNKLEGLLEGEL